MVEVHGYVVRCERRIVHSFDGLFEDGFAEVFPVDAGDVFGGVAGFVGDDDVFGEVVFVADDADVEVRGADGAEEGLDAVRFVEVGGDCGGCDSYVILRVDKQIILINPIIKHGPVKIHKVQSDRRRFENERHGQTRFRGWIVASHSVVEHVYDCYRINDGGVNHDIDHGTGITQILKSIEDFFQMRQLHEVVGSNGD